MVGTILIFLLTSFLSIDQHIAQGTNLIFFVPTCISSIIVNLKNKNIIFKIAIPVVIAGIIGAIIGAKISVLLPINILKKCFGIFLIFIVLHEIYSFKKVYINKQKNK